MVKLPTPGTRYTEMPELPEVETIKRELEKQLIGKTFDTPLLYHEKTLLSSKDVFLHQLRGKRILSLSRKGKFLFFHLSEEKKLVFHLRMEGKLYVENKERHSTDHLVIFFPFLNEDLGLAFYDVRKFGICEYTDEKDLDSSCKLGPEPFDIKEANYLFDKFHSSKRMIKELLLDQTILSGIGNIYANEILFDTKISPFLKGFELTKENCRDLLISSQKILAAAIANHGSTIRTYHSAPDKEGNFQAFLKIYGKKGQPCPNCSHIIEKRYVDQRGTEYCPHCQNTGITLAITGKIASGKSLATSYFKKEGFVTFSADECVHKLYEDQGFLKELKAKFPMIFTPELNKGKITLLLSSDPSFKRSYLSLLFRKVKEEANSFIIENNRKDKALEIPVLFDAHMQDMFSIIVGVETTKQRQHLIERGDDPSKASFNSLNSYDKHREQLSAILHSDGTKKELHNQVKALIAKLRS